MSHRFVPFVALSVACSAALAIQACGSSGGSSSTSSATGGSGGAASTSTSSTSSGHGGDDLGFDGGHADAPSDSDACGSVALTTHVTPGNIVVVFDQSNTMSKPFSADDAGPTKPRWQVAQDSLVAAVTPIQNLLNLGALFFPTAHCVVDPIDVAPQVKIEPAPMFLTDFQGHFSAPGWDVVMSTPMKEALDRADQALPDPSPLQGARAVVLLTDGAPTCATTQADIVMPVQAMAARGIKTYVIGLPGSDGAATLLNAIAQAGGTGSYVSPTDPGTLQNELAQIAQNTLDTCSITLDPPPSDPSMVHLIVTDAAHPEGVEIGLADAGDGWSLSADAKTATLLGGVCTTAKNGGYTSLTFVYGCPKLPT